MFILVTILALVITITNGQYQEVWKDDFNDNELDSSNWYFGNIGCTGNGNNEQQCYTDRNIRVQDGNLVIQAKIEPGSDGVKQFTSSRIHGKRGFKFGKFEIRAKLPKGRHLWPAIWMMPLTSDFGQWPVSGEIDIMEYRGQVPNKVEGNLHYGDNGHVYIGSGPKVFPFDFSQDFHVFGLEKTSTKISWFVDGTEFYSVDTNHMFGNKVYKKPGEPWDRDFYFIFNVAVGGNFFNGFGTPVTVEEARMWEKSTMEIDWIKVSRLVGENGLTNPGSIRNMMAIPACNEVCPRLQRELDSCCIAHGHSRGQCINGRASCS